jgi:hypothetical protein
MDGVSSKLIDEVDLEIPGEKVKAITSSNKVLKSLLF